MDILQIGEDEATIDGDDTQVQKLIKTQYSMDEENNNKTNKSIMDDDTGDESDEEDSIVKKLEESEKKRSKKRKTIEIDDESDCSFRECTLCRRIGTINNGNICKECDGEIRDKKGKDKGKKINLFQCKQCKQSKVRFRNTTCHDCLWKERDSEEEASEQTGDSEESSDDFIASSDEDIETSEAEDSIEEDNDSKDDGNEANDKEDESSEKYDISNDNEEYNNTKDYILNSATEDDASESDDSKNEDTDSQDDGTKYDNKDNVKDKCNTNNQKYSKKNKTNRRKKQDKKQGEPKRKNNRNTGGTNNHKIKCEKQGTTTFSKEQIAEIQKHISITLGAAMDKYAKGYVDIRVLEAAKPENQKQQLEEYAKQGISTQVAAESLCKLSEGNGNHNNDKYNNNIIAIQDECATIKKHDPAKEMESHNINKSSPSSAYERKGTGLDNKCNCCKQIVDKVTITQVMSGDMVQFCQHCANKTERKCKQCSQDFNPDPNHNDDDNFCIPCRQQHRLVPIPCLHCKKESGLDMQRGHNAKQDIRVLCKQCSNKNKRVMCKNCGVFVNWMLGMPWHLYPSLCPNCNMDITHDTQNKVHYRLPLIKCNRDIDRICKSEWYYMTRTYPDNQMEICEDCEQALLAAIIKPNAGPGEINSSNSYYNKNNNRTEKTFTKQTALQKQDKEEKNDRQCPTCQNKVDKENNINNNQCEECERNIFTQQQESTNKYMNPPRVVRTSVGNSEISSVSGSTLYSHPDGMGAYVNHYKPSPEYQPMDVKSIHNMTVNYNTNNYQPYQPQHGNNQNYNNISRANTYTNYNGHQQQVRNHNKQVWNQQIQQPNMNMQQGNRNSTRSHIQRNRYKPTSMGQANTNARNNHTPNRNQANAVSPATTVGNRSIQNQLTKNSLQSGGPYYVPQTLMREENKQASQPQQTYETPQTNNVPSNMMPQENKLALQPQTTFPTPPSVPTIRSRNPISNPYVKDKLKKQERRRQQELHNSMQNVPSNQDPSVVTNTTI
jgi:hypothetical protein